MGARCRHVQVAGVGVSTRARDCQGVEAPWPLVLACKSTQLRIKHQKMPGDGGSLREGEAGAQRRGGTRDGRTPQRMIGN